MSRAVREYWRSVNGRAVLNFNWDAINADSTVHVAAAEWSEDPGSPQTSPRFVGAANITVRNVAPHGPPSDPNHGVTFVVTVDWAEPLNIVTDIVLVEDAPVVTQHPELAWVRLPFGMQPQQQSNWCWSATTVSVANYYGDNLTQCGFANTLLSRTDCCGMGAAGPCNVPNALVAALQTAGHLASWRTGAPSFGDLQPEIDAARPVTVRIQWSGGGGHFLAVVGYLTGSTTWVAVDDPAFGPSDLQLTTLTTAYQTTGSVDEVHFTM